jgi:hypothetical protein
MDFEPPEKYPYLFISSIFAAFCLLLYVTVASLPPPQLALTILYLILFAEIPL